MKRAAKGRTSRIVTLALPAAGTIPYVVSSVGTVVWNSDVDQGIELAMNRSDIQRASAGISLTLFEVVHHYSQQIDSLRRACVLVTP